MDIYKETVASVEYYRVLTDRLNGGLLKLPEKVPPAEFGTIAFTSSIQVDNFYKTKALIIENGGQTAMPGFAIPDICWQGYFVDLDNNIFGIKEINTNAK